MALESVTHISDLNVLNPTAGDPKAEGDDHLRNIKTALKTDLPNISGAMTATHTALNAIAAGTGNTATGTGAANLGGTNNTVGAAYGANLGGTYATTRAVIGATVQGSGGSSTTSGQAQIRKLVLSGVTTDATPTVIVSDASAAGTANQLTLANNQSTLVDGLVVAHDSSDGKTASWVIRVTVRRLANAASTAIAGSAVVTSADNDTGASPSVALAADTTNGCLKVTVTGIAAKNIRWTAWLRAVEASA